MGGDAALRLIQLALLGARAALAARPPIQLRLSSLSFAKAPHPSPTWGKESFVWLRLFPAIALPMWGVVPQYESKQKGLHLAVQPFEPRTLIDGKVD